MNQAQSKNLTCFVQEFVFCLEKKMNFKKIKKRLSFKEKLKN